MRNLGFGIIVIGLIITLVTSFTFLTKEKVIEIGDVEVTRDKKHNFAWSPFAGIAIMVIGGGLLAFSAKKN